MPDPRAVAVHDGIGYHADTFPHDDTIVFSNDEENGSAQVGLAVTLEANNTVSLVGDGENVLGRLVKVESDGFCVVQTGGYMRLPGGDSATLTPGSRIVGDLGADSAEGYIQSAAAETAAHHAVSRGMIVDASDSTDVLVRLEVAN